MKDELIAAYLAEISSLEGQVRQLVSQIEEIEASLSQKTPVLGQLENEREGLKNSIRSLGFFKFKERKPLKKDLAAIAAKIEESENIVKELKNKVNTLTQQENELKSRIQIVQLEKEKFQKEEELKELAAKGDPQAQFDVAKLYLEAKNSSQAMEWLKKAIENGHEGAKKLALQIEEDEKRIRSVSYDLTLW